MIHRDPEQQEQCSVVHCADEDGADGDIGPYLFIQRIFMRARNLVPFLSVSSVCSLQGTYREEETAKRYDENA